jgi:hypothetical protein
MTPTFIFLGLSQNGLQPLVLRVGAQFWGRSVWVTRSRVSLAQGNLRWGMARLSDVVATHLSATTKDQEHQQMSLINCLIN